MSSSSKPSKNVGVQGSLLTLTNTDITTSSSISPEANQMASPRSDTVIAVSEKHLSKGTDSSNSELTQIVPIPSGSVVDTSGWAKTGSIYTMVTQDGILRYNGRNLTFTLRASVAHNTEETNQIVNLNYQVRLTYEGKPAEAFAFIVKVTDDTPIVSLTAIDAAVSPGSTNYSAWAVNYGADGAATSNGLQVCFNGGEYITVKLNTPVAVVVNGVNYGEVIFYPTGAYVFKASPTASSTTLTLGLKATDGDGDVVTNSTTITIDSPLSPAPPIGNGTEVISEANLADGTAPNADALTKVFAVPAGYTVNTEGWNNEGGIYYIAVNNGVLAYDVGGNTISFTLTSSLTHAGAANQQSHTVGVPLKNAQGVEVTSALTVRIEDDMPAVSVGSAETNPGGSCQGSWSAHYGADGAAATQALQVKFGNGAYQNVVAETPITVVVNGINLGTIVFHSDNQYSFTANPAAPNTNFDMALRATDRDGDPTIKTANIAIAGDVDPVEPPASIGGASVILDEANLAAGSAPDAAALTANFTVPAGFTVDTEGWLADGEGNYSTTAPGVAGFLVYYPATNTLSFTLDASTAHTPGSDSTLSSMDITLLDTNQKAYTVPVVFTITDDSPVVALTAEAAEVAIDGTVLGNWNVHYGADEAAASDAMTVSFDNGVTYQPVLIGEAMDVVKNGQSFGSITFNNDGTYSFTASAEGTISLSLKGQDTDGDATTISLTLTITDGQEPTPGTATITVDEKNLQNGTEHNAELLTKVIELPEGSTVDTTVGDWTQNGSFWTLVTTNGSLVYDQGGNSLSYTLGTTVVHGTGATDDSIKEEISIGLIGEGDIPTSFTIIVNTLDDAPVVTLNQTGSAIASGESVSGVWEAAFGADGKESLQISISNGTGTQLVHVVGGETTAIIIDGVTYGDLVFSADEKGYTFVSKDDAKGTLTLTLVATDTDGDVTSTDPATITITEGTGPIPGTATITVDEKNLQNGTEHNAELLTKVIELPEGSTVDTTVGDWTQNGSFWTLVTTNGSLVYDQGGNSLSYTLGTNVVHGTGATDDSIKEEISIGLIGEGDIPTSFTIIVNTLDDAPVVSLNQTGSAIASGESVSGVWEAAFGADGKETLQISISNGTSTQLVHVVGGETTAIIIDGVTYGDLVFSADEKGYTFVSKDDAKGTLTLTLVATDTDGDVTSTAPATITITEGTGPIPGTATITVDEMNLQNGTEHNVELLTKVIELPEGSTVDTTVGSWVQNGSFWTLVTTNGSLVYDQGGNSLSYTLGASVAHGTGATDDSIKEEISIGLIGEGDIKTPFNITVNILDDAPVVTLNQTGSGSIASGESVSGVWDAAFGADGKESLQISISNGTGTQLVHVVGGETTAVVIDGVTYGDLVFSDTENTYTFVSKEGVKGTLTLTLVATDTDGDVTSTEPATITITTVTPPLPGLEDVYLSFDEANLSNGSAPDYDALVRVIGLPEGYTVDTAGWVKNGSMYSLAVNSGVFRYNGRSLTFTLRTSSDHDITLHNEELTKEYALTLKGADENPHSFNVVLTIQDDAPSIYFGHTTGQVTAGSSTNGMWIASFGADGKAANGMQVSFDGGKTYYDATVGLGIAVLIDDVNYGRITFNAGGTYTFKANPAIPNGNIALTLKITDGDGDIATQDVTLTVSGGVTPAPAFEDITINEANLDTGTDPNAAVCTQMIPVPAGYKVSTIGWVKTGDSFVNPVAGGALIYNPTTNILTYTLYSTIEHGQGIFDDSFSVTKSITLVGPNGEFTSAPVTITIVDDAPVVTFANSSSWSVNFGADGAAGSNSLSISFDNGKTYVAFTLGEAVEIVVNGTVYGTVTFNADNTCVFTAAPGKAGSALDVTLKATDADGDSTTQNLAVTLPGGETPVPVDLGDLSFTEQHLATGTNPDADALVKTVTLPEGTTVNTTGWAQDGTVWGMTSGNYSLAYDSEANTLIVIMTSATTHTGEGNDVANETITVALLVDGKETTGNISIAVTDDAPVVTFSTDKTSVEAGQTITGTWAALAGADGEADTDYLQISFDNGATYMLVTVGTSHAVINNGVDYGTIEFAQDGSYSFISSNEARGPVTLTLKATDSDGDSTTQTVSLTVTEPGVEPVDPVDLGSIALNEQHLATGTSPDAEALIKTVTLPEGTTVNTTGWTQDGTVWNITSGNYSLAYDSEANTLVVTMASATTHTGEGNDVANETITVALLVDGKETTGNISIAVTDDAPVVTFSTDKTSVEAGQTLTGTWAALAGADGEADTDYLQISFDNGATYMLVTVGTSHAVINNGVDYGTIEFAQDGSYSFISNNEARGPVTLTLKATDGDGDSTTQTVSLTVTEPGVEPVDPVELSSVDLNEDFLPAGTTPAPEGLIKTSQLPVDVTVNTSIGWTQDPENENLWSMDKGKYILNYDSNNSSIITVTLLSATTHTGEGRDFLIETVTIAVLANGKETTGTIDMHLIDDVPVVTFSTDKTSVEAGQTITGTWAALAGADGEADTDYLQISFDNGATYMLVTVGTSHAVINNGVDYGTIEFAQDGSYSFISTNEARGPVTLTLKATDGDGDSTTQTVSLTVTEPGVGPVDPVVLSSVDLNEDFLPAGTTPFPEGLSKISYLPIDVKVITSIGWTQDAENENLWTMNFEKYTLTYDSTQSSMITVTLLSAIAHTGEGRDFLIETVTIAVMRNGEETTGTIDMHLIDDVPVVTFSTDNTSVEAGQTLTGTWDVLFGADGESMADSIQLSLNGGVSYMTVLLGGILPVMINGVDYGTISFLGDNAYVFESKEGVSGTISLTLRATDSEGDSTTQTVSLTVTEPGVEPGDPVNLGAVELDEKYTELGTAFDPNDPTGTVKTIDLPSNTTIDTKGWVNTGDEWSFTSPDNTYSFIYNSLLNQLSVSLFNAVTHTGEGRDTANATITFPILVDGEAKTGNLTITVIDDAPVIIMTANETPLATGETFVGEIGIFFGADGAAAADSLQVSFDGGTTYQTIVPHVAMPVVFNGTTYGTISFNQDGNYEFISAHDADGSVSITIKATDADGDVTIDERSILLAGSDPVEGIALGTVSLDEKHMELGTDYDGTQTTKTITLPANTVIDTSSADWQNYEGGISELTASPYSYQYNANTNELSVRLFSQLSHTGEGRDTTTAVISFPILVDGEKATGNLTISVIDDAPVISFGDEDTTIKSGEILNGTWEHSFGADGNTSDDALQVSFDNGATYQTMPLNQDFPLVHEGITYGTLLLGPDRNYTFKSAEGVSGSLNLTIKLTDGDGDSTTQNLPITITPTAGPLPVTLEPVTLDESNLGQGTATDLDALTKVITLPAGYTVDTTATGWTEAKGIWSAIFEAYHFDYDPDTRALYITLTGTFAHTLENRDSIIQNLTIPLLDKDGASVNAELKVTVKDDIPVILTTQSAEEIESGGTLTGTYEINYGADGKAVGDIIQVSFDGGTTYTDIVFGTAMPIVVSGLACGSITFTEDGNYSFTSAQGIKGTLAFVLKGTDSEGDAGVQTIQVVITEAGEPGTVTLEAVTLDESNLELGTATDLAALTKVIALPADHTVDTTVTGWTQTEGIWSATFETYRFDYNPDTRVLSVTLTGTFAHTLEGSDSIIQNLTIPLLDKDGASVNAELKVTVKDDIPVIQVTKDAEEIESGGTLTGTYEINYGADGKAAGDIPQISLDGGKTYTNIVFGTAMPILVGEIACGSVIFTEDGNYTFTSEKGIQGTLTVIIKATDSEGDAGLQAIQVVITEAGEPGTVTLEPVTLDESNLGQGTATDLDALTKVITLPADHTVDTTVTGWTENAGIWSATFEAYRLDYNPDTRVLSVTLTGTFAHTLEGSDSIIQDLTIPLLDKDGASVNAGLKVTVKDDIPVIQTTQSAEEIESGGTLTGTYEVNYGADGKAVGDIIQVSFDGGKTYTNIVFGTAMPILVGEIACGSIVFTEDGNYTFTSEQGIKGTLAVLLKATDSEGDASVQAIQVVITEAGEPGTTVALTPVALDESNLEQGTATDLDALTKVITLPADYTVDTTVTGWTETAGMWSATFEGYRFDYNPDTRALSITLTGAFEHTPNVDDSFTIELTIPLRDEKGASVQGTLEVTVKDDRPLIQTTQNAEEIEAGGILTGTYEVNYGADGKVEGSTLQVSLDNGKTYTDVLFGTAMPVTLHEEPYGSIIFTEDGNYTFTSTPGTMATLSITLQATDSEGDVSVQALHFVVAGPGETPTFNLGTAVFDEKNLEQGTEPSSALLDHMVTLPDGYTIDTELWAPNGAETEFTYSDEYFSYKYTPGTNGLTITMINNFAHETADIDTLNKTVELMAKDGEGNPVLLQLNANIIDDIPVASFIPDTEMVAAGETLSGTWSAAYGADGPYRLGDGSFMVSFDGNKTFQTLELGANEIEVSINGTIYGTLILNANNTYTFTANPGVEAVIPVSIRVVDSETVDMATAGFTLTIVDQLPEPGLQLTASVSEKNLLNGTAANAAALEQVITLPDNHTVDTTGWDTGAGTTMTRIVGDYGLLTYNTGTRALTFTLTGPVDHGNTDSLVKNITLTLLDGDNTPQSGALLLTIVDDAPTAIPMFDLNLNTIPGTGEVAGVYYINPKYGADGNGGMQLRCTDTASGTTQVLDVTPGTAFDAIIGGVNYGTFFFTTDMSYTFKASGEAAGTLSLELLMVDSDGDFSASKPVPLTIHEENYLPLNSIEVLESNLPDGTSEATSYARGRIDLPDGYNITTDGWTSSTQNGQTVFTKDVAHGTLSYSTVNAYFFYTLTEAIANDAGAESFITNISLTLHATKNTATQFEAQFTVTIEDDSPLIDFSNSGHVQVVSDTAFTSTWAINYGADSPHAQQSIKLDVSANGDGQVTTIDIVLDQSVALMVGNKNYGTILFESATGKYHITANKEYEGDTIQLTLKGLDTDGDTGLSGQLSYTIIKGVELPDDAVFGRSAFEMPTLGGLLADEASLDNLLATLPAPANAVAVQQETTLQPVNTTPVFVEPQSSAEEDMLRALSNTL